MDWMLAFLTPTVIWAIAIMAANAESRRRRKRRRAEVARENSLALTAAVERVDQDARRRAALRRLGNL